MSDMEKVDLDALSKKQHPKQQNRPQPIQRRRPFRQENRQENKQMMRTNNRKQQGGKLFQLDVFHLMADNNILHLINDIRDNCGNLEQVKIVTDKIRQGKDIEVIFLFSKIIFKKKQIVLHLFFTDRESSESFFKRYNDAQLDGKQLEVKRRY